MDPTILAALIGAVATAGSTAASEISNAARSRKNSIACTITNQTPFDWKILTNRKIDGVHVKGIGKPLNGIIIKPPDDTIPDMITGSSIFSKDLDPTHENNWESNCYTTWAVGDRKYSASIYVYQIQHTAGYYAAFFARNYGKPKAGVLLSLKSQFEPAWKEHDNDTKGKWIRRHILDNKDSENCVFSDGDPKIARIGNISVTVIPGKEDTKFTIRYKDDDWGWSDEKLKEIFGLA